jgi:bacteriorhodopsin
MKEHPEDANGIRILADKGFMEANGPRPSCPYGNCNHVLGPHDVVGTTFYIACNMMLAFSVFFFMERSAVAPQWGTSVLIAGLVTFIAFYNYTYMKDVWVLTQNSPTVYRYTDWLITVPMQVMEFYFVLASCGVQTGHLASRLMVSSLLMLLAGWLAETDILDKVSGFVVGCLGWLYVVAEVWSGGAGKAAASKATGGGRQAFETVRAIVTFGWTIYPIGYALAYIVHGGGWAPNSYGETMLVNICYNLADLVNKGAFGMAVWAAAKSETRM